MLDTNTKLTVLHDNASVFSDYSNDAFDFSRDTFSLTLNQSTSYLYIGFYKPINQFYIGITTPNTNANTFTAEIYNGSSWVYASGFYDDTKGFTRSGSMRWDINQSQSLVSVNGTSLYWIRLRPSVTHSATVVTGVNFIFADDQDLTYEVPEITDTNHLAGKTSHILTHVAVRNEILQALNNKDYKKLNDITANREDLTAWDILEGSQLKQAAVYLALSKIYFNFSDATDDKYHQKSKHYYTKYKDAFQLSQLSLDENNDGVLDDSEKSTSGFNIIRIKR